MFAAHEACAIGAQALFDGERQQQQRTALAVMGHHDEGPQAFALADLALPGGKEVEALIGCVAVLRCFETAPGRLGCSEVVKDVDAGDADCVRPCSRARRLAFHCRRHGHLGTQIF